MVFQINGNISELSCFSMLTKLVKSKYLNWKILIFQVHKLKDESFFCCLSLLVFQYEKTNIFCQNLWMAIAVIKVLLFLSWAKMSMVKASLCIEVNINTSVRNENKFYICLPQTSSDQD